MTDDTDVEGGRGGGVDLDGRFDALHRYVRTNAPPGDTARLHDVLTRRHDADRRRQRLRGAAAMFVVLVVFVGAVVWRGHTPGDGALRTADQDETTPTTPPDAVPTTTGTTPAETGRITISPLVDLHDRLTRASDTEVFTVRTSTPTYWRLTALDTFDGQVWRSGGTFVAVDGPLPTVPGIDAGPSIASVSVTRLTATFTIGALATLWLPAPYRPTAVDPATGIRYQGASSTLIVDASRPDANGSVYRVDAELPAASADELRAARTELPADIRDRDLEVPDGLDPSITAAAREQTATATTAYDRAQALADWFRRDFAYDASMASGHDGDAVARFLRDRRGHAEQFASAYALMARSLGLPARVAVGFTPGDADGDDPTRFHVFGRHAHAWPEVFLGEYGWVAFEPTPGRSGP